MAVEIERKFLLKHFPSHLKTGGSHIQQGYMINEKNRVIRIRLAGENGFLTLKGATSTILRKEFEYTVPKKDAEEMLALFCEKPLIDKTRFFFEYRGFEWIIDEFHGSNAGLLVAEIELDAVDQVFEKPDWIGKEVTHDPRYLNSNLVETPYSTW